MPSSDLVQSLSRGLEVLEAVGASAEGVNLKQVCVAAGLKAPTAHNLLRTLVAHGFVEKIEGEARYQLGRSVLRLAERFQQRALLQRIEAEMVELARAYPRARFSYAETVGEDVVVALRLAPELRGGVQRGPVQMMHPYATASTLLHQALWPAEKRAAYARRYPLAEYGGHVWPSSAALDAYLERVRADRLAEPELPHDNNYRLAVAVFDNGGRFAGALGAFLLETEVDVERRNALRSALVEAAARVPMAKVPPSEVPPSTGSIA